MTRNLKGKLELCIANGSLNTLTPRCPTSYATIKILPVPDTGILLWVQLPSLTGGKTELGRHTIRADFLTSKVRQYVSIKRGLNSFSFDIVKPGSGLRCSPNSAHETAYKQFSAHNLIQRIDQAQLCDSSGPGPSSGLITQLRIKTTAMTRNYPKI